VPGLAVVIPYRASLFDSGCINDSLRRLNSVDVGGKRNSFEFCKLFIEEKFPAARMHGVLDVVVKGRLVMRKSQLHLFVPARSGV
jgi:hypothetical protein